jgi:putative flippase GtrA
MVFKFLKFGITGLTGMVIDFSITFLLKEKLKVHRYLANSAGFTVAATSNYFLNRIWTFHSSNPRVITEYGSFFIISLIGLGINNLFLYIFEKKFKFYLAKLFAIGVTMLWNFFANYYITFSVR